MHVCVCFLFVLLASCVEIGGRVKPGSPELLELTHRDGENDQGFSPETQRSKYLPGASQAAIVDEAVYCSDDLYMGYLRQHYLKHIWTAKKRSRRRLRGKDRRARANQAIYFASSLLGPKSAGCSGAIPVADSAKVQFWLSYFTGKGRDQFLKWLVRAHALEPIVAPILTEQGMPPELFYLAMIESGLNPRALSHAGAGGLWQFLKPTARMYGLKVDGWVDERRDPHKSTHAAATYLKNLYHHFDDWHLAMAAYNAGPGRVRYAIRKSKTRDYWSIINTRYLRLETKNYVPKLIAALFLAKNYAQYGFTLNRHLAKTAPLTQIEISESISLNDLADRLGLSRGKLKKWNPEILRGITPPLSGSMVRPYLLRIDSEYAPKALALLPSLKRVLIKKIQMHTVAKGETLGGIARRYRLSLARLRSFNKSIRARRMRPGQKIAVPIPAVVVQASK